LHKFLVGESGIVVHNTCLAAARKYLDDLGITKKLGTPGRKAINDGPDASKIKSKFGKDPNKKMEICYNDAGFPIYNEFLATINGLLAEVVVSNLAGDHSASGDFKKVNEALCAKLGIPYQAFQGGGASFPGRDDIKWSWHHHEDGKTMQLIPTDVNGRTSHVGGKSIIEKGGKGVFPGPGGVPGSKC